MRIFLRFGFVLLFLVWGFDGVGQSSTPKECGTREPTKEEMIEIIKQEKAFKQSLGNTNNLVGAITVYIKFHNVLKTDGTGRNISSETVDILYHLNQKFASVNITFAQSGAIDYVYESNYYNFIEGCNIFKNESELREGRDATNAINIYFAGTITYGVGCSAVNGYISDFPSPDNPKSSNAIFIRTEGDDWRSMIISETIPHEMGHYFNLLHTHENGGDLVEDTPFDPKDKSCVNNCVWNCTTYNPDVRNLMSYYHGCRYRFTSGQYQRMQEFGKTYRTNVQTLLSQRYYLDGTQKALLQLSGSSKSTVCAGNNISMQFNSYGEPYFCTGTFYLQMKLANNNYFTNISSDISIGNGDDGEVTITGVIPSNTPSGYYNVRIYKTQSQSYGNIEEKTIYVNGTASGVSGEPIISGQYLSASSTIIYNATSTCVGNSIRMGLYEDTGDYGDTYWWTKDGLNYTASSTSSILVATQTGTYSLNMIKCGNLYRSSNSIYLKFHDLIAPTIIASSNGQSTDYRLTTCDGSPVTLSTNCSTGVNPIWSDGSTSSIRYINASSTRDFMMNCNNYFCNTGYSPPVRITALNPNVQSTKTGNWQDVTLWTSNLVPLNCQTVTIQTGHTVNVPINDAKAKKIILNGKLNFINVSPTVKGKVGLGI